MVGHQHVGMEWAALALQGVPQPAKVGVAILVIEEAGPTIMATLHDVQRYTVGVDARMPRRGRSLPAIEPGHFFPIGPVDTLIAGAAVAAGATLVSHHMKEFGRVPGLRVIDWFRPCRLAGTLRVDAGPHRFHRATFSSHAERKTRSLLGQKERPDPTTPMIRLPIIFEPLPTQKKAQGKTRPLSSLCVAGCCRFIVIS